MERRGFLKTGISLGMISGLLSDPFLVFGAESANDVRQIIIRTSWNNTNVGEIASLQASQNIIQRGLPRAKLYLWPARKDVTFIEAMKGNSTSLNILEGNISASNEPDNQELTDVLSTGDILLWIGGDIQDDIRNDNFSDSINEFSRVLSYCNSINLKYGIYGTSFNDLSEENVGSIKPILSKSVFIFTRESESYELIKSLKTDCKEIQEGTDINFGYNLSTASKAVEYLTSFELIDRDFVTLIIKTNLNSIDLDEKKNILSRLSQIIKAFILEHEIPFLILPSDIGEIEISRQYIFEPLKGEFGDRIYIFEQLLNPEIAQPIIDKSRFIVSMDINCLVLAYSSGTPGLYLSLPEYGNEISIVRDLGLKDWSIDFKETEDSEIKKAFNKIHKKYVDALVQVDGVDKQVVKKQDTMIQLMGKLLYSNKKEDKKKKKKEKNKKQ